MFPHKVILSHLVIDRVFRSNIKRAQRKNCISLCHIHHSYRETIYQIQNIDVLKSATTIEKKDVLLQAMHILKHFDIR